MLVRLMGVVVALCVVMVIVADPVSGHEGVLTEAIVVDTDMGLDDAVTLAMVLQHRTIRVVAVVATEGAASREGGARLLQGMIERFNRSDVPIYGLAEAGRTFTPPAFREFSERAVGQALRSVETNRAASVRVRPLAPEVYTDARRKTTVLVLGPLTNLAAALTAKPEIVEHIDRVIVAGHADPERSWNLRFDPDALVAVRASGVKLLFVAPGDGALKSDSLGDDGLNFASDTSPAGRFLHDLFADAQVFAHYLKPFVRFHDELAFMYLADHDIFEEADGVVVARNYLMTDYLFRRLVNSGRQGKQRVVFAALPFPESMLQRDVAQRRERIIAKHGEHEWFAQLLMNEIHEHLGAYSIIGVKMGLYAAELLNAPQHGMRVVSHAPLRPPMSCLNDGLIVATGCSPGRMLFAHEPLPGLRVEASFTSNGRMITLRLKDEYRHRIRERIETTLETYTLEDEGYWDDVRSLGLEIWENWHRRDLFEVVPAPVKTMESAVG